VAWARHVMCVADTEAVKSVCVIPGEDEDQVWFAVHRHVNAGTAVVYVERMASRFPATQADSFFVDSGVWYDSTATETVSGLDHLEGETVVVLGDGAVLDDAVVASGDITLSAESSKVAAGRSFRYKLKPMRIEVPGPRGNTHGSLRKIAELVFSVEDTLDMQYGKDLTHLFDIPWRRTETMDDPPSIYTGDWKVVLDAGFDVEDPILLTGEEPLPCTVRAIVVRQDVTGR